MFNGYLKFFEEIKYMTFILEDKHKIIFDKYNEPVHYNQYL